MREQRHHAALRGDGAARGWSWTAAHAGAAAGRPEPEPAGGAESASTGEQRELAGDDS